jgi:integrase
MERLGTADDYSDADGIAILSFKQAQDLARSKLTTHAVAEAAATSGPLTVREAIEDYLVFLEHHRKSARNTDYRARASIYPTLGDSEVAVLTTKQLRNWFTALGMEPRRQRTAKGEAQKYYEISDDPEAIRRRRTSANRTLTVLKAALNRQWREGRVASDAAWRRVQPFNGVEAARVRYLTVAEAQRLINAADPDFRALVEAALHTGCRYGELVRLEVADFNPDAETLAIRISKSGKARHVELTDEGALFFRQHCGGRSGSETMLRKADGTAWGVGHQASRIVQTSRRARISPLVNFHALRHTWASLAVMNGVPLLVVAKNLGHADTRMVERHYGHLAPSFVRDAIRAGAPKFGFAETSNVRPLR